LLVLLVTLRLSKRNTQKQAQISSQSWCR
ncbi:inner membrane protein yijD, partial [Vibrio parahaemolyticus AQ3810]